MLSTFVSQDNLRMIVWFTSYSVWKQPTSEFCCRRTSTETIPSPGRPNEITTPEIINKIHDIVLNNLKVEVRKDRNHLNWAVSQYFAYTFVHEKALC